jgi:hypothetical protein
MGEAIEGRDNPQEKNRNFPTTEAERRRRRAVVARYDGRTRDAAKAFFATVFARSKYIEAGRTFIDAAEGLHRQDIIECVIAVFASGFSRADPAAVRRAVLNDFDRNFGWRDLHELAAEGVA